jgi:thymidylate synthase (FAD)
MRVRMVAHTVITDWIPEFDHSEPKVWGMDRLAEMAGRLCYLSWRKPNALTATNKGYIANIIGKRHFSVLEHSSASFYIDGVTRNFTHELIRHRHLSFSEVSQRYVDVGSFPFILHPGLEGIDPIEINTVTSPARSVYRTIMDKLTAKGLDRKKARQAARHVLPGGTETKILVTGNLRAWREVLEKRLSPTADEEFRQVAQKILAELRNVAPNTFQDFDD